MKTKAKIITISSIVLVLALAAFIFFKFCFVFGEGVKAGQLNQLMYKGYVFKTFEGRLIQSGFKGQKGTNSIQSNEFNFSVVDKAIADSLMRCSGRMSSCTTRSTSAHCPGEVWRSISSTASFP